MANIERKFKHTSVCTNAAANKHLQDAATDVSSGRVVYTVKNPPLLTNICYIENNRFDLTLNFIKVVV